MMSPHHSYQLNAPSTLKPRVRATSVPCPPVPEPVVEVPCRTESVEAPAPARREEGEDREYVTPLNPGPAPPLAGCNAGRMQRNFHHALLASR